MTVFQDVENHPPSASDLAWEADRLTLSALPEDQRRWFEALATSIFEAWPIDDPDPMPTDDETALAAVVAAIGEHVVYEGANDDEEAIGKAVAAALEEARAEGVKDATIPSRANTAARKAMRLLVDGRVAVKRVVDDGELKGLVVAEVRGDSGEIHTCGHDPRRRQWRCTCPEMKGDCSHLAAVKMIVPIPRGDTP